MPHQQQTLLLDMDGTLLDLHFDNHFWLQAVPAAYAQKQQITQAQAIHKLTPYFSRLQNSLNWYCTDYWSDLTGLDIIQLKAQHKEKIQFLPSVKVSLQTLKQQYQRLIIITNAHPDSVTLKDQQTQISTLVDAIISAHSLNACKEQPEFWQRLNQQLPLNLDNTHFIDDNAHVLHRAHCFGVRHLYYITRPDSQLAHPNPLPDMLKDIAQPIENISYLLNKQ